MTAFSDLMLDVLDESSYGRVSTIVGNENDTARKALAVANRVIQEMAERFPWRELWKTGTVTLADGDQTYALPDDFSHYHFDTFWNQGENLPMYVIGEKDLAFLEGYGITGLSTSGYYIRGIADKTLNIYPTPDSGDVGKVVAFEYTSLRPVRPRTWASGQTISAAGEYTFYNGNYYTSTGTGTTGATPPTHTTGSASDDAVTWTYYAGAYNKFLADTDEVNLNERIFTQGVLERLSVVKGQNVVPLFDKQLAAEWSRQAPAPVIQTGGSEAAFTYARNGKAIFSTGR